MNDKTWIDLISGQKISGLDFCLQWYGQDEMEWGDKQKFISLLSKTLNVSTEACARWGARFEKMPQMHQSTLYKIFLLNKIINSPNPSDYTGAIKNKLQLLKK